MPKVISIYKGKTQFSKLIKKLKPAKFYIGAYKRPQAIPAPAPIKRTIKIGIWAHKKKPNAYVDENLIGSDSEINNHFEDSVKQK